MPSVGDAQGASPTKSLFRNSPLKNNAGFTLLEAVIAISLWLILSAAVLNVWGHGAVSASTTLTRHNAFENARIAVDAIAANIQLADEIIINTTADDMLRRIRLRQVLTRNEPPAAHGYWWFIFDFGLHAPHEERLVLHGMPLGGSEPGHNPQNYIATHLAAVKIRHVPEDALLYITATTTDMPGGAITLTSVVDVRGKIITP